jgi:magnesium transporter
MLGEYIYYNANEVKQLSFKHPREIVKIPNGVHWVHVPIGESGITSDNAKDIQTAFNIDRLTWEDIVKGDHLPKVEVDGKRIFMVMQVLRFDEPSQQIIKNQVSILIQNDWVLTFLHGETPVFEVVLEKLKINRNSMRERGPDYLLYSLMGTILNLHFQIFERVEDKMDRIESLVMRQSKGNYIHDLYKIRKEIMKIKSAISPMKDMIRTLLYETTFIQADDRAVFQDLNDRLLEINESLSYYRELVNALYDMHLSNASNRMNQIMTTLTVYSAIFIPLTFLAGVYGMNFKYMPEMDWVGSYPVFILGCLVITGSMLGYFKRKKWL